MLIGQLFWLSFWICFEKLQPLKGLNKNHMLAGGVWIRGVTFQNAPWTIALAKLLIYVEKLKSLKGHHQNHMLAGGVWIRGVTFSK